MTSPQKAIANLEAERAVLGSLLIDNGCRADLGDLAPTDFYSERNRWIYAYICDLIDRGLAADLTTVADALQATGAAYNPEAGDITVSYLAGLVAEAVTAAHAGSYAALVRQAATRRRLAAAAAELARLAYDGNLAVADLPGRVQAALDGVFAAGQSADLLAWDRSFAAFARDQEEEAAARMAGRPQLSLPWRALAWVRPLQPGTLAIIAADSGQGKTLFMECCAETWARRGFRVLFVHTELSQREMLKRRICRWTGLTMAQVESLGYTEQMRQAQDLAARWPGRIDYLYAGGASAGEVIAATRQARRAAGVDVLILDYLQDLRYTEYTPGQTTADMRGGDVQAIKRLAETAGLAVLAGAQFNRGSEAEKTRHRIRDSAWYDLKASLIMLLERKRLDKPLYGPDGMRIADAGEYSPETTITVDKQTGGRTGRAQLWCAASRFLLTDVADAAPAEEE